MVEAISNFLSGLGVQLSIDALLVVFAAATLLLGLVVGRWMERSRQARHQIRAEQEEAQLEDRLDQLNNAFGALSHQALQQNNELFLSLAKQSFSQLQAGAAHELETRERSIANLLQPIQKSMQQTDEQLRKLDKDREVSEARISEQIANLLNSQHALQSETRNLVTALRRPEVRGQWGELTLKRLVELAGMSQHCDFQTQVSVQGDSGVLRPDMIIHLPSERQLVVDVKTPLDAYISAAESADQSVRAAHLQQHCKNVRQRIKELGQKKYWQQFERSPDFIVLFIPGDQFLSAALDQDQSMLEYALQRKVLLATPTSLVGLLRAIAYGWNQESLNRNSEEIRTLGESLYQRLQILTGHMSHLGKTLDSAVDAFNKVVGSYESTALPAARKLSELGISGEAAPNPPTASSASVRTLRPTTEELEKDR